MKSPFPSRTLAVAALALVIAAGLAVAQQSSEWDNPDNPSDDMTAAMSAQHDSHATVYADMDDDGILDNVDDPDEKIDLPDDFEAYEHSNTDPEAPGYSWPAVDYDNDGVFDRLDRCPGTKPGVEVDNCGCALSESDAVTIRPVAAYPPGMHMRDQLLRHGKIVFDMAFFDFDRAELRPEAMDALDEVADIINDYPTLKFEVSGHADSRGSEDYNKELSEYRAEVVENYLKDAGHVRGIQLVARGYGEERLATAERDEDEYQANRRVEFRVVNPEAMPRGSKLMTGDASETLASQYGVRPENRQLANR